MSYETRILPENNGYVGYVLLHDELIYTTGVYTNTNLVIQNINEYIKEVAKNPIVNKRNSSVQRPITQTALRPAPHTPPQPTPQTSVPIQTFNNVPRPQPSRRCCGRG